MSAACAMRYRLETEDGEQLRFSIESSVLNRSIAQGVARAFRDGHLALLSSSDGLSPDLLAAQAEMQTAVSRLTMLKEHEQNLIDAVARGGLPDNFLRQLGEKAEALQREFERATAELRRLETSVEVLKRANVQTQEAGQLASVLQLVSELRNPHSNVARRFLRHAIDKLSFTQSEPGVEPATVTWQGALILGIGSDRVRITFEGQHETSPNPAGIERLAQQLRAGVPQRTTVRADDGLERGKAQARTHLLAAELGLASRDAWVVTVRDPLLLRAYLSLLPTKDSGATVATTCTVADSKLAPGLIDAARRTLKRNRTHARCTWLHRRSRLETDALIGCIGDGTLITSGALGRELRRHNWPNIAHEWAILPGSMRLRACPSCGGTTRARLVIDEPAGYVCLRCRADGDGTLWPAEPYDQYVAFPSLWAAAGVQLLSAAPEVAASTSKRTHASRKDRLEALTPEQRHSVIDQYRDGHNVREIARVNGLRDHHDVYAVIEQAGVPKRAPRKTRGCAPASRKAGAQQGV